MRPRIVVGASSISGGRRAFEIVVPLTSVRELAIDGASVVVDPTAANGCRTRCYALAWNLQSVPNARLRETPSRVCEAVLTEIRVTVCRLVGM